MRRKNDLPLPVADSNLHCRCDNREAEYEDMKMRLSLLEALQSVVFYNGLSEELEAWKDIEPDECGWIHQTYWPKYQREPEAMAQLQAFWMICVELFGNCGTSPRFGWIEDRESFKTFIDLLTRCGSLSMNPNEDEYDWAEDQEREEKYEELIQHVGYTQEACGYEK